MKVYSHPSTSSNLKHALNSALPYSIALAYRTQHQNQTPDTHILATFSPSSGPENATSEIPQCWAAAYFDRSMRPETELWIFATGEVPGHPSSSSSSSSSSQDSDFCPRCREAVMSLLSHMRTLPVPPMHPSNLKSLEAAKQHSKEFPETGPDVRYPPSSGSYLRHLLLPSVVTLGAVHHKIAKILLDTGLICAEFPGLEAPVNKFLFKISDLPETRPLPDGLRWGEMRPKDIAIVQARTHIPRATHTLLSLKSVAVFEISTDQPVAWAFSGLDGSLTTLHVETEWRGRGIAKAVAAKVFREYAGSFTVDKEGNSWAHADVYIGNVQSEAVCRSLGGVALWEIFWVRVDVSRALETYTKD
ncbi:hypothetical protein GQ43DRAFT_21558 [Delitschia confertaspora ATCC 74209]|uniref:FR47-like domain-containing protein n=1 Tax=Delitschia confertaspora ATCC 74209 TaxID=1513339 RepID=A0A9P4MZD5_9PLEO|nr:hypothetical protein GQ43DRAFT_21558 [Delitschia confertaspora ATCC 74209]